MFVTKAAVRPGTCAEELLLGPERFVRRGCPFCACVKILWIKERRGRICCRTGGLVYSDCAPVTAFFVGHARQVLPFNPLGSCEAPVRYQSMLAISAFRNNLDESSVPRLRKLPCCCPAVRKGLFSLESDFWPLVSCPSWPPCSGKSMVVDLSADILLWLPVKMRWDKPDKRCPCSVVGALIVTVTGMVVVRTEQAVSCANISVCLWVECSMLPSPDGHVCDYVSLTLVWTVAEAAFHCPLCPHPAPSVSPW